MSAYIVAMIEVTDPEAYKLYTARSPEALARYGGRFLVRGGTPEVKEGPWPVDRMVILEFADIEAANRFYHSPEYQEILPLRHAASKGVVAILPGVS